MSLHMSLSYKMPHGRVIEVASINWLRNPFGLERWAEWNANLEPPLPGEATLYYIANQWAYGDIDQGDPYHANRLLFRNTVDRYSAALQEKYDRKAWPFYFAFESEFARRPIDKLREYFPTDNGAIYSSPNNSHSSILGSRLVINEDTKSGDANHYTLLVPMRHFDQPNIYNELCLYRGDQPTLLDYYMSWFAELVQFAELLAAYPEYKLYCDN